ncbi:hypothetical protein NSK_003935 [Nannochloropsis salina CCMP1776]|uniref:Uncharacterized protein n=1 Tax=Nannochloropsis salina CCMP1776 TaxID=1027361 RepID=A0A4D9D4F6_9STRA|nr:hypothetical protein NSK_003935 [Nannochloropsis salina CCMP1776]|eukprot:TFJ84903.1 hypothetical protein NSK_003935 [Nannochloropsis salina CCMP1776]
MMEMLFASLSASRSKPPPLFQRSSQPLELHRCHCTGRLSIRRAKWDGVAWKGGRGRSPPSKQCQTRKNATREVGAMARAAAIGGDEGEAPRALGAAASISVIMTVPVIPQTLPSPIPQAQMESRSLTRTAVILELKALLPRNSGRLRHWGGRRADAGEEST